MLFIYYKFYECCVIQLEIQVHTIYFTSNSAIPGKVEIQAHTISFICSSAILCKVNIQAHSFEQWCTNITCNMRSGNQYIALPLGFKWISGIRRICCTLRRKFEVPKNWYSSLSLYLYKYLSYLSFPALRSIIRNRVLKRLQAHRTSRKLFCHRLCVDIEYRERYLFVHETDDPHICCRKCPPLCLTMRKGLKEVQRLIDKDIGMLNRVLVEIEGIPLQHLLDTYRIREI